MGKVLAFRRPEEKCVNCWYFAPHDDSDLEGQIVSGYCRHPDRTKASCPDHPVVERLGLHCDSGQWCPKYVNVDSPAMKKLQFVSGIKFVFFCMKQRLRNYTAGIEKDEEYRELVDQFYQENRKLMTINQYKATKRDAGYFAALIEETIEYYKQESKNRK